MAIQHFTQSDDEREQKVRAWERSGWREMSHGQRDEAWDRFWERFGYPAGGPFRTPADSATFGIAWVYLGGEAARQGVEADLSRKALAALKECTRPGEEVLVLDWNHPCYFFDPHAEADDPATWPVPVLPDGDHYIFLARDHRFGVVGNCVDMTVCVFDRGLVAAFAASRPAAFGRPTWTAEARRANEARRADLGWRRLTVDEKDEAWGRFDSRFGFDRRIADPTTPAIEEPAPSVTWAVEPAAGGGQAGADELDRVVLTGLQAVTSPGERLYCFGPPRWYEHYTFDPHRLGPPGDGPQALWADPDGGYVVIVAADLRFGVVGNPVEGTLCVFGEGLLRAVGGDLPPAFGRVVRRDGVEAAS